MKFYAAFMWLRGGDCFFVGSAIFINFAHQFLINGYEKTLLLNYSVAVFILLW